MLLKTQWVNDKIKEEIIKYLETNINKSTTVQKSMRCSKSSSKRETHSDIGLPQETRKISNKQPNIPPKRIRKRKTKPKVSKRREIIKLKRK